MSSNNGPESSTGKEKLYSTPEAQLHALRRELSRSKEIAFEERDISSDPAYMGKYAKEGIGELIRDIEKILGGLTHAGDNTSSIKFEEIMGVRSYILYTKTSQGEVTYTIPLSGKAVVLTDHPSHKKIWATVQDIIKAFGV